MLPETPKFCEQFVDKLNSAEMQDQVNRMLAGLYQVDPALTNRAISKHSKSTGKLIPNQGQAPSKPLTKLAQMQQ
jgi:hypothetical protein